jgi:cytochrome d ubiquinol oxidase subunit I
MVRYFHVVAAALTTGAFFMTGIAAYLVLKGRDVAAAKKMMLVGVSFGLAIAILNVVPFGHEHARQVARTQPEKFAAIEGLYTSTSAAPMVIFAYPMNFPPELKARLEIPGVLSWLAFGDPTVPIKGINEFPLEDIPPLWLTFVSFHNMVLLGVYFILIMAWTAWKYRKGTLWQSRILLRILVWSIPLPVLACQLGWIAAEVGRQPWIVYKLLRTSDAVSVTVSAGEILFSLIMFFVIYLFLGVLYLFLLTKKIKEGPESTDGQSSNPARSKEVIA